MASTNLESKELNNLACLGTGGIMLSGMSKNLLSASYKVFAYNRTPERANHQSVLEAGAISADTIETAVKEADLILICVSDIPDVEQVTNELAKFAPAGTLIVDLSTIGPEASQRIGTDLQHQGFRFLEAPVTGGDRGAKNGTLTIMTGGNRQDFETALPVLESIGKKVVHCGELGAGQALKLVNQILCALYQVGISEALQFADRKGVDANAVIDVCGSGAAGSWALTNLGPRIINNDFNNGFPIQHMLKDLRLVRDAMGDYQSHYPGVQLAFDLLEKAANLDQDTPQQGTHALIKAYQND